MECDDDDDHCDHAQQIRQMWKHYYKGTDGVIYVIDSSDTARIDENKREIENLLRQEELKNCCLLIIANKMDKGALFCSFIFQFLFSVVCVSGAKFFLPKASIFFSL